MIQIPEAVTRAVSRQALVVVKHSPRLMFGAGIVGVLTGTVLACRATTKLDKTLDTFKQEIDDVKQLSDPQLFPEYEDVNHRLELAKVYARNTGHLVRLYAPAAVVTIASVGALTGAHVTLNRRNASLTAAYSGLTAAYEAYRSRVREELGEEKELEMHRGIRRVKQNVDGKVKTVKVLDPNAMSMYSKCFDVGNPNWHKNAETNRTFLQAQQNYFNHMLTSRGHLFLNEVYEALGFPMTRAGQIVGWVITDDIEYRGDRHVDLGLFEAHNANFMNGTEYSVWIDPNVDGDILHLIDP